MRELPSYMLNEKLCIRCNRTFLRTKGIGTPVFAKRKYCSQFCSRKDHPKFGSAAAHWKGGFPTCKCGRKTSYRSRQCSTCYIAQVRAHPPGKGLKRSPEARRRMSEAHRGIKLSPEHAAAVNKARKSWNYIPDRTKLKRYGNDAKDRRCYAYTNWRRQVWLRDNFTCKIGNPDCNGRIEAHHILTWKEHPSLRYEINNGITLCHFHHPKRREDEKRLQSDFQALVSVSKEIFC